MGLCDVNHSKLIQWPVSNISVRNLKRNNTFVFHISLFKILTPEPNWHIMSLCFSLNTSTCSGMGCCHCPYLENIAFSQTKENRQGTVIGHLPQNMWNRRGAKLRQKDKTVMKGCWTNKVVSTRISYFSASNFVCQPPFINSPGLR